MTEKKNFLESLTEEYSEEKEVETEKNFFEQPEEVKEEKKENPASFKQETFTRIEKNKINFSPKLIGISLVCLILLSLISYFLFFAPKINMPDFTGKSIDEFTVWANQNKIEKSGVAMNREYNFEYDKDTIISQSIKPNKKIKKNTLITLTVSDGADPNEVINFPDISSMDYDELQAWIKENKLLKTKITTEYSVSVEENKVIKYDLKNVSENNFTRGTNLNISVSKGPAPAGQITVEDFTGKNYEEMNTWARNKKVNLEKREGYSDSLQVGYVISQSVKSGNAIKEGDTIEVVVSKGKAVKIPNLVGYNAKMLEVWSASPNNKVTVVKKEVYNEAPYGDVISQSIPANSAVDEGSVLELTVSLYRPVLQTSSRNWYGKDYMELQAWVDDSNYKGANIAAGYWMGSELSDEYPTPGQIISYVCADGNGNQLPGGANGCERPLPLDAKISMKISAGKLTPEKVEVASPEIPVAKNGVELGSNVLTIKTSPNASVNVKKSDGTIIGSGVANVDGYVDITLNEGLPEFAIITATLNGQTSVSDISVSEKPSPSPETNE